MKEPQVKIEVNKCEGEKCPRCWKYWGIPENPLSLCDSCTQVILDTDPEEYVGNMTPNEFEGFRVAYLDLQREILHRRKLQKEKYLGK